MAHKVISRQVKILIYRWEELSDEDKFLLQRAAEVRENAIAPYSHYKVGAAILWEKGHVSIGCNMENCIYNSLHAEKMAIGTGIVEHGLDKIMRVTVLGDPEDKVIVLPPPKLDDAEFEQIVSQIKFEDACVCCGQCLQDVLEFSFGDPHGIVLSELIQGVVVQITLGDILTAHFGPWHLDVDYRKFAQKFV